MGDYTKSWNDTLDSSTYFERCFNKINNYSYGYPANHTFVECNETLATVTPTYQTVLDNINVTCYLIICAIGLIGNCLVIYVVIVYAKMKTVTNMYILNLAFSDIMFLTMLPITATTVILKHWVFGLVMCKIHFALCAINIFGGAFNLCVMSADRYLAVCHPVRSIKYRTPPIAFCMCMSVWVLCFLLMLPFIMYPTIVAHHTFIGKFSCRLMLPPNLHFEHVAALTWYSFILGFIFPVSLITIFYILVIVRLRTVGAAKKSSSNRRSHGRVTRLIFSVVAVYVCCWLPYWCFQIFALINGLSNRSIGMIILINVFTILSQANSMLNPLLYAFLSENFRQNFLKAFKCFKSLSKTRSVCYDKSPCTSQTYMRTASAAVEERVELTAIDDTSVASPEALEDHACYQEVQDDRGFLKPPVKFGRKL